MQNQAKSNKKKANFSQQGTGNKPTGVFITRKNTFWELLKIRKLALLLYGDRSR
jgi:hypothetical protein